jgi:hypothetical protein
VLANHTNSVASYEYGWCWRLGHPSRPMVLRYVAISNYQAASRASSTAIYSLVDEAVLDIPGSPPYGNQAANPVIFRLDRGMPLYSSAAGANTPLTDLGGYLVVASDDQPGQEYFTATIICTRTTGTTYLQNLTFLVFRSPTSPAWNAVLFRSYGDFGFTATIDGFCWNAAGPVLAPLAMTPALTVGVSAGLNVLADNLELLPAISTVSPWIPNSEVPRLLLPQVLWGGMTNNSGALQKLPVPGRDTTAYQLQRPSLSATARDLFVEVAPDAAVLPGWEAITVLPWTATPADLYLMPQPRPLPLLSGPSGVADLLVEWPNGAAAFPGVQQHPVYSALASGGSGGGNGGGGGSRPSSGVLWPRGSG